MKSKTSTQVPADNIQQHLQDLTDDVAQAVSGGFTFADSNLPFQVLTVTLTSGKPASLKGRKRCTGGCLISSQSPITISSQTVNTQGEFVVTAAFTVNNVTATFLLILEQ
jgi:hypothetical protein